MSKYLFTESQLRKLISNLTESETSLDEFDYQGLKERDDMEELREAIKKNIMVSVAFVKKDGTVRHMAVKRFLSSYVPSEREKTEKQLNIQSNNNIYRVIDMNAYIKKLKELRTNGVDENSAKQQASTAAWRTINLETVLGFMVRGKFVDLRDENEILQRYGQGVYDSLTKSMKDYLAQDQEHGQQVD